MRHEHWTVPHPSQHPANMRIPPATLVLVMAAAGLTSPAWAARHVDPATCRADLLTASWPALWIAAPDTEPFDYSVQHFRREFELTSAPERFVVHVTADNRYQLFVNGERVAWGPARGDLNHWRFESLDIASHLRAGRNTLAAVVWNHGQHAGEAQCTWRTGFLLHGDGPLEAVVDTGSGWKALGNQAYEPIHFSHGHMRGYYVVGPGDRVDGARFPWGWEQPGFDDSAWPQAERVTGDGRSRGSPRDSRDAPNRWLLVPRGIPAMEETPLRFARLRSASGITPPAGFPANVSPIRIPTGRRVVLLLDQNELTTGYPELVVSGGQGAQVRVAFAESLFEPGDRRAGKGNRDAVEGKAFVGNHDLFLPDGGQNRLFRPLWWRTWRYVEVTIQTADEPLVLEDIRGTFAAYPFERRARFDGGDAVLDQILDVGWRTARLCAHESYMDCPYYEQLQYAGDSRIQCLISYTMSGDGRLARRAIAHLDASRTAEGATMSRAPTRQQQYIPGFSLWWIGMVHDYWRYQDDPEFVRAMLPGVRAVLGFFAGYQQENGSLGPLPWWNYVDWVPSWPHGTPPAGPGGASAPHDLQLALALAWAAELEAELGSPTRAAEHREQLAKLRRTIRDLYWAPERKLFSDTPEQRDFSEHSNALAVLAGIVTGEDARGLMDRVLSARDLTPCSIYFRHYLNEATLRAGLGDRYLEMLGPWKAMLDRGLTTWAERPESENEPSRSDCHAWSSSPNVELFRTVLGIESAAPAMAHVRIAPHLGHLDRVSGSVPHPLGGDISVALDRSAGALRASITLPAGVDGTFVWAGESHVLRGGTQVLDLP